MGKSFWRSVDGSDGCDSARLLLEGCAFDESKGVLVEGTRTSPLTSVLPLLTLAWMSSSVHPDRAISSAKHNSVVTMPMYIALRRERLIAEVHLHTENARQRVLNSAALFLTENE